MFSSSSEFEILFLKKVIFFYIFVRVISHTLYSSYLNISLT